MSENQTAHSILPIEGRPIRHFERTLQLVAAQEVHNATPTNWAETCHSLQGKIQTLVREMELMKEQVEVLSTQNMVLRFKNEQQADEIFYLKDEVYYLREELERCHRHLPPLDDIDFLQQPSNSHIYTRDAPRPITRVIDEIDLDLLDDDDSI